ncbi:histidine phosphatase family protein [Ornithinimicrobium pratense]|uniref:Histidine phosphatase family protein n=1 Tax=Ornithinimicrobium pratense TaxID=2593973 RepID=A0A5J6V811_9MICO|nr:histidine phosphatase family protein [Ornithinimicrobium pratense]QFG69918.1 histidine phosphatase family protein [Ornithinimicrobium pratense]
MTTTRESLESASEARGLAELVLVRHGESMGNLADRAALDAGEAYIDIDVRDADVELSETGIEQAQAVRDYLRSLPEDRRPTAVLSSPYRRARQTAEIVVEGLDLPLVVDERVRERDLGAFDGMTWIGIEQEHADESRRRQRVGKYYYRPPGGESWVDVVQRVRQILLELQERYAGERLWVFSHQATVMSFRVAVEGLGEAEVLAADKKTPLANCSTTVYRAGDDGLELVTYGDTTAVDRAGEDVTHEPSHGAGDGQDESHQSSRRAAGQGR